MDAITLPPELERFAEEAVVAGRYRDLSDALAAGLRLLQRQEQARADFVASLDAAISAGERDGFFTIEQVERDMDAAIEEVVKESR